MIDILHFEFGEVRVFKKFIVVLMKEGITVKPKHNKDLIMIAEKYFSGKKFGYITYRINSYAVDPLVYIETSKIENLIAFAVVVREDGLKESNVEIEKLFFTKPFRAFHDLDQAKDWVLQIIEKAK